MTRFKVWDRVFYKFNDKHPYEKQPLNQSKIYGKGRITHFLDNGMVVVSCDNGKHEGASWADASYAFYPHELLSLTEYNRLEVK